ncbi:hypothetical protein LguiB_020434 [Lonicera macranthoides]
MNFPNCGILSLSRSVISWAMIMLLNGITDLSNDYILNLSLLQLQSSSENYVDRFSCQNLSQLSQILQNYLQQSQIHPKSSAETLHSAALPDGISSNFWKLAGVFLPCSGLEGKEDIAKLSCEGPSNFNSQDRNITYIDELEDGVGEYSRIKNVDQVANDANEEHSSEKTNKSCEEVDKIHAADSLISADNDFKFAMDSMEVEAKNSDNAE